MHPLNRRTFLRHSSALAALTPAVLFGQDEAGVFARDEVEDFLAVGARAGEEVGFRRPAGFAFLTAISTFDEGRDLRRLIGIG